jgi:cytosine/adenosine deaminase-related metal-dependent hydrolase
MSIKTNAGVVVTANERMEIWQPGYLVVDGQTIVEAGPGSGPSGDFDEVIDASGSIVMPGLVNAHTHSPSNLLKGSFSRLPLEIWRQYIRAGWREYSDEAIYVSAQLGVVEMIRTGTTSVMDHFYTGSRSPHMGALSAVEAMHDAGMRGGLALTLSDREYGQTVGIDSSSVSQAAREEMDRISQFEGSESLDGFLTFAAKTHQRTSLVTPIVGPSAPHRCTDDMMRRSMQIAIELGTTVHVHVCETKGQFLQGRRLFGTTVVAHLDEIGILNERLSMAHCVWFTDDDIKRVANGGAIAIHNPASNGKLGSGLMRFDDMLAAGVRLGLATDGSCSNDTQNMFESMRFAGTLHNHNANDYQSWPSPEAVLRAATSGSAWALGLGGKAGAIAPGWLADLVVLTMSSYHFAPLNDVVNQLVYCENGISITDVMIDGRWVMRDRRLTTIDEARLYARARDLRAEMAERVERQFENTHAIVPSLREAYLKSSRTPWSKQDG